jgi:hypothetical protein
MSTVSRGFRGRRRPSAELSPGQDRSTTCRFCRRDRPASTSRTGRDAGLIHETTPEKGATG